MTSIGIHKKKAYFLLAAILLCYNVYGLPIAASDTSYVNQLLREGQKLHYLKPDSAIFFYQKIFDNAKVRPETLTPPLSAMEGYYVSTVIMALNYAGNIHYYNDEYKRAEIYYQRSLKYSEAADLKAFQGRALFDIGYIRYVNNDYAAAGLLFDQSYHFYKETDDQKGMYGALQARGSTYRRTGDFSMADSVFLECLSIGQLLNDSIIIADVFLSRGILLCEQGMLEEGILLFEKALDYYQRIGNQKAVSAALLNIGVVMKMVNEYDRALEYIKQSTEIEELQQQKSQLVVRYYNLADLYLEMGHIQKAREYCQKIQVLANEIGSRPFVAECSFLMGKYHLLENDFQLADKYLKTAADSARIASNKPLLANIYLWLAKAQLSVENNRSSIESAMEAYSLAKQMGQTWLMRDASLVLSQAFEKIPNLHEALKWHKAYLAHGDEISHFEQQKEIKRIEARYNFEKKEQENELLRNRAALQEQKIKSRTFIAIASVGGIVLSLVIILLLIKRSHDAKLLYKQEQMINLQHIEEVESELAGNKRELTSKLLFLNQKNELINRLINRLQEIQQTSGDSSDELVSIVNELKVDVPQSSWREFETQFIQVHPAFYQKLTEKHPDLSSYEQRICAFLRMNLNTKEISSITGRSSKSIEVARSRIRHKLNLSRKGNLNTYLASI